MPKLITGSDADFLLQTEVPRDTEDVDAIDVERPIQDLLNNDGFLYARQNAILARLERMEQLSAGFRLSVGVSALQLEPGRTFNFTDAVQVARFGGFSGAVTLSLLNLPGGVTATATPNPIPSGSTAAALSFAASAQAVPGTYDVLVRAEGGGKTSEIRIPTIVTGQSLDASFSLSGPTAVAIDRATGTSITVPLDVARIGGFNSQLAFDAAQIPAGVTAAFAPATVSGTTPFQQAATVATLTAASTVPAGTYTVVLRATGGGLVRTQSLTLNVSAAVAVGGTPDFSLSIAYDAGDANLINGATLTINRSGGYTGPVVLTAAQLPGQRIYGEPDDSGIDGRIVRPWITAPAPYLLINGQLGSVTITGNTARLTADGLSTGWLGSGVAPRQTNGQIWQSATITGTDTDGKNRYAAVDVRYGGRA